MQLEQPGYSIGMFFEMQEIGLVKFTTFRVSVSIYRCCGFIEFYYVLNIKVLSFSATVLDRVEKVLLGKLPRTKYINFLTLISWKVAENHFMLLCF